MDRNDSLIAEHTSLSRAMWPFRIARLIANIFSFGRIGEFT
jgi:hypothetical protein